MNLQRLNRTIVFSSCLLSLILLSSCEDDTKKQTQAPKVNVVISTIAESKIQPHVEYIGRTEATEDVSIRAQVEGLLLKRNFSGGDDVQKGDLLFEIDPAPYSTLVMQQKAVLAHAESAYEIANNRWQRGKKLRKSGTMSEMDIDELTAQRHQTKADVALKQAALKSAELNLSYTKIIAPIDGRISRSQVSKYRRLNHCKQS